MTLDFIETWTVCVFPAELSRIQSVSRESEQSRVDRQREPRPPVRHQRSAL